MRLNKRLKRPLQTIKNILPAQYSRKFFLDEFKKFYSREWKELEQMHIIHKKKDDFLVKRGKKRRYYMKQPEEHLLCLPQVKGWFSPTLQQQHAVEFCEAKQLEALNTLIIRSNARKEKLEIKTSEATKLMQDIDPLYIDAFIAAYHKKGIDIRGKMEIFNELKKFNADKAIDFFYKLNDSERNNQIRNMAFMHLQSIDRYVKLRKGYKGKKKVYMGEKDDFNVTPEDLWDRIKNNKIQNAKMFDVFISHSLIDHLVIPSVVKSINSQGYTTYCDWTSDNDFLKRELVSDYTKMVLKKRLNQSKSLLLVKSTYSLSSEWVEWELEQFKTCCNPIFYIELDDSTDDRLCQFTRLNFISEDVQIESIKI